jgi:CRP-like cAMP-binding protein
MSVAFEPFRASDRTTDLAPLDRVGWLAEQPPDFRDFVAREGRWRRYPAGAFLYHAGDAADGLYGLGDGALDVTFPLVAEEPVTVHRAEIGFWIGDNAEFAEAPRMVSVTAARDSRILHVPSRAVRRLLAERPEHWRAFYRLSARNTETAVRLLSEALSLTVRARVCRRLLRLAGEGRDAAITQADLAALVGVTRSTLKRALASLGEAGAIEQRYGGVRVLDAAVLARFADEQ